MPLPVVDRSSAGPRLGVHSLAGLHVAKRGFTPLLDIVRVKTSYICYNLR